jgi:predicted dehydrogenase
MNIQTAAVIGTGFIGTVHIEAIRRMGVPVKGALAGSPASTESAKSKLNLAHAYKDVAEIAADKDVTVVHVTSPNALHFDQVTTLLNAGKHVICEKPLALTASEGESLLKLAESKNLVHALCFNTRFYPMVHEARSLVNNGKIGSPTYVNGSYHQDWLLLDTDWNWRLVGEKAGELRAIADIGSHLIDQISFVSGLEVESVLADLHTIVKERKKPTGPVQTFTVDTTAKRETVTMSSDDAAGVLIRYKNGARGTLSISQVSAGRKNNLSWEISGTQSALAYDSVEPEKLWIGHRGTTNEISLKDPTTISSDAAKNAFYPGGHIEGFGETFRAFFERVYADIESSNRKFDYPNFKDGVISLRVTDAIAKSSKTQSWVKVEGR